MQIGQTYLVGDVSYKSGGTLLQPDNGSDKDGTCFSKELEQLMEKWDVVKIDIGIDPTLYIQRLSDV